MSRGTPIEEASLTQQKALAIFPKFLALASLCCSCYIAWDILFRVRKTQRNQQNWKWKCHFQLKVYHELVLGMSLSDMFASSAWFFTTWPIPPDAFEIWGAKGTVGTCSAQGFFTHLSIATVLYTGCLAMYFFLVIHRGWKESDLHAYYFPQLSHAICIGFALVTAIVSLALGLFNPIGWDCWIAALPPGCDESWEHAGRSTCTRGDNASLYQWLFFYIPSWLVILAIIIIFATILRKFRRQERIHQLREERFSSQTASRPFTTEQQPQIHNTQPQSTQTTTTTRARWTSILPIKLNKNNNATILRTSAGRQRLRDLEMQSLCYIGSFLATWTFPTVLRIHEILGDTVYFHFVMLSATFIPSQGVLNALVYLRPQYIQQLRKRQRDKERQKRIVEREAAASLTIMRSNDSHDNDALVMTTQQEESQASSTHTNGITANTAIEVAAVTETTITAGASAATSPIHYTDDDGDVDNNHTNNDSPPIASTADSQRRQDSFIREMSFGLSGYLLRSAGPTKSKSDADIIQNSLSRNKARSSNHDEMDVVNDDRGFSRQVVSEGHQTHAITNPLYSSQQQQQSAKPPSSDRSLSSVAHDSFRAAKSKASGFRKVMQRLGDAIAKGDGGLGGMGIDDEYETHASDDDDDDDGDGDGDEEDHALVNLAAEEDGMPTISEEHLPPSSSMMMKSASERPAANSSRGSFQRNQSVHFA